MEVKKVRTFCRLCYARCRLVFHIQDGRITSVMAEKEPLCPKGKALGEIVHAPDRLLHPMKKEGSNWKRISWDNALRFIAEKLNDIKSGYGPQALDIHMGYATTNYGVRDYIRRFGNLYGTPNISSSGSQCNTARVIGNTLTYGCFPVPDYERTKCIVLWGSNPSSSNPYVMRAILNACERGAKLIVVDPRNIPLAQHADVHLQLRPGTDRLLALEVLRIIIEEGLYDRDFVSRWTLGFDKLEDELQVYKPKDIQEKIGISLDLIRQAARLYGSTRPACIVQVNALEHHTDGVQGMRAIAIIQAICGNLDVPGGAVMNPEYLLADIGLNEMKPEIAAIGSDVYPLYNEIKKEAQGNLLADVILEEKPYPIKGMIIIGANPVLTFPNSSKLEEALEKLDFLAVMDNFLTKTAEHADIILPATTFLEEMELYDLRPQRPLPCLALATPVIPAQGESWPGWRFLFELARQMGYNEYFPWKDIKEAISFRLRSLEITIEQLEKDPNGILHGDERYKKYEERGFVTPSGKVEIYSEKLESLGYNPLPIYSLEGDVDKKLILSVGARDSEYIHSRFRNIPYLRRRRPEPFAEISPETAREYGFKDRDNIIVRTGVGEIEIKVKINDGVIPGTVFIPHGWAGTNANILTDNNNLDPISGFPSFKSVPCTLEKKAVVSNS